MKTFQVWWISSNGIRSTHSYFFTNLNQFVSILATNGSWGVVLRFGGGEWVKIT